MDTSATLPFVTLVGSKMSFPDSKLYSLLFKEIRYNYELTKCLGVCSTKAHSAFPVPHRIQALLLMHLLVLAYLAFVVLPSFALPLLTPSPLLPTPQKPERVKERGEEGEIPHPKHLHLFTSRG